MQQGGNFTISNVVVSQITSQTNNSVLIATNSVNQQFNVTLDGVNVNGVTASAV
jgi:hypothetical protein